MSQKLKTFFKSEEAGARIISYEFLDRHPSRLFVFIGCECILWHVQEFVVVGIFGVALHFVKNWRVIFRVDK